MGKDAEMDISENSSESGEATELSEIESLKMQLESVNEELSRQTALAQDYLDTARRVQAEFGRLQEDSPGEGRSWLCQRTCSATSSSYMTICSGPWRPNVSR